LSYNLNTYDRNKKQAQLYEMEGMLMKELDPRGNLGDLNKYIEQQMRSGTSKEKLINQLRDKGFDSVTAETQVNHIHNLVCEDFDGASSKDLKYGFGLFAIGAAITIGTWKVAQAGGTYWVMWGALAWGLFYLIRGFYRKIKYSFDSRKRSQWVAGGLVALILMVGGGAFLTNQMMNPYTPDTYLLKFTDKSSWENLTQGIFKAEGTVLNNEKEWSIENIVIKIEALDSANRVIKTFDVNVQPFTISPGGSGTYSSSFIVPNECTNVQAGVSGKWIPPK
jgi:hypothetical protein